MAAENWLESLGIEGIEGIEAFEGAGVLGIAAGIGAALLAPVVLPLLGQAGKPIVKNVVKQGMMLYEKGKESIAEVTDAWEDILAEAQYEVAQSQSQDAAETQPQNIPVTD